MEAKYHCSLNGQSWGPYTLCELQDYVYSNQLPNTTLVWNPSTSQWEQIQHFLRFNPPNPQIQMNPTTMGIMSSNQLAVPQHQSTHINTTVTPALYDQSPHYEAPQNFSKQNEETHSTPSSSGIGAILCGCCYIFAVIDFMGMFLGYDITGVSWSPMAAGFLGTLLAGID